jgi:flagellar biosynthesis protein FlhB
VAEGGGGEKTEAPTPKKLKEGREQGQVARSSDLGAWLGVGAAALLLPGVASATKDAVLTAMSGLDAVAADPDPARALAAFTGALGDCAIALAPLGGVTVAVAIGATAAQGGLHLATKAAKPQFSRLNPWKGLKRIAGPNAWWEGLKALLKTVVLGIVLWRVVVDLVPHLVGSGSLPLTATLQSVGGGTTDLVRSAVVAGLVIAAVDFVVQKRRIGKQLKMSRKEIQDEHKQSEGDPLLKGAIRSKQMAMSRNRMMSEIAKADVVLVNPTHVAVALRYDPAKGAPRVVAKGAGAVAAKIRERAAEHRVPMVEDVPLARALHKACEIGQEIPSETFAAIAQVLAFVMRLRSRGAAGGIHKLAQPSAR